MLFLISNLLILFVVLFSFYFLWQGAIYVPSSKKVIGEMLKLSKPKKGGKMADLGSGDGRILIAFAKRGIEAHGYEINPMLYFRSKNKIRKEGLEKKAFVHFGSYWTADLSKFGIVTVFGIDHIMKRMENKLYGELKPGAIIITNLFPLPSKQYVKKLQGVFLYRT